MGAETIIHTMLRRRLLLLTDLLSIDANKLIQLFHTLS